MNKETHPPEGIEIVEHTADWSIRVTAGDLATLLQRAAEGMTRLMVGPDGAPAVVEARPIALEAYDVEGLLVAWLGELAYFAERDQFIGRVFEVSAVSRTTLRGVVHGGRAAVIHKHIKAVTYHGLDVHETDGGLEATIVFDV